MKFLELAFNLHAPSEIRANAIASDEIHISWRDGNRETAAENRVDYQAKHRFYIILYVLNQYLFYPFRYGPKGSSDHKKITTEVSRYVLRGLSPGTTYEISIRTVMPGGQESPWSPREIVKTPDAGRSRIF